jgi:hypothetical protein
MDEQDSDHEYECNQSPHLFKCVTLEPTIERCQRQRERKISALLAM